MSTEGNNGENVRKTGRIGVNSVLTWFGKALVVSIFLLPALLVAGWLYSTCFVSPWEAREEKARVEAFLKEKYGKEFVAVKCEKQLVRYFLVFSLFTEVHLAEDPDISFTVGRGGDADMESEEMKEKYRTGNMYSEDYLQQVWSKEAHEDMKEEVERIYGEGVLFSASVNIGDFRFGNQMFGHTPSYKEYLGSEIELDISIRVMQFQDVNTVTREDLEKAFELLQIVKGVGASSGGMTVGYYLNSDRNEIMKDKEGMSTGAYIDGDITSLNGTVSLRRTSYLKSNVSIHSSKWEKVSKPTDFEAYITYWNTKKEEEEQ